MVNTDKTMNFKELTLNINKKLRKSAFIHSALSHTLQPSEVGNNFYLVNVSFILRFLPVSTLFLYIIIPIHVNTSV